MLKWLLEPLEGMAKTPLILMALEFDPLILLSVTTKKKEKPFVLVPPEEIMISKHVVKRTLLIFNAVKAME